MIEELITIYKRDLNKLKNEIEAFQFEDHLWKAPRSVSNSAGNLALHITGNLNHYIGAILGKTGYERNRPAEFEKNEIPKKELITGIMNVSDVVEKTLNDFEDASLASQYPRNVFGYEMTNSFMLIHLATHLSYHIGQINYIRRVLE
jgi:uncharacterized damage-inducible protein DinB